MSQGTILSRPATKWAALAALVAVLAVLLTASVVRAQVESSTFEHPENSTDAVAMFTATDPEGATPIAWYIVAGGGDPDGAGGLTGDDNVDSDDFTIDGETGELKFAIDAAEDGSSPGSPDFENPQGAGTPANNTYNVVVVACDVALVSNACPASPDGQAGYHKVTVKVTNVDETGKITWTVDPDGAGSIDPTTLNGGMPIVQFQVGAVLAIAETGGVTDGDVLTATKEVTERLQWYRSPSKTAMGTAIEDDTPASYTVTTEDIGMYLRVEAFYNVGTGREESASRTSDYPVLASRTSNDAPEFDPSTVTREVSEGKKGMTVGAPVTATDNITNALNYTLGGADAARFKIDQKTGQITTLVDLDREGETVAVAGTLGSCAGATTGAPVTDCTVTVTATDSAGEASDPVATVTIKITNVDEKPTFITDTTATPPAVSPKAITSPENETALWATGRTGDFVATAVGVTYRATDPDDRNITYRLMGPDGAKFSLSGAGVLSFVSKPDYEMPTDVGGDNVYDVTVRATDGTGMTEDRMVKVTVTDENDAPVVSGPATKNHAENSKEAVATFTAVDPEGVTPVTWSIAPDGSTDLPTGFTEDTDNADENHFDISKEGVLTFDVGGDDGTPDPVVAPDFEAPKGAAPADTPSLTAQNTYRVVVAASDGTATGYHKVVIKVTNVAETGKVTWTVDPDGAADTTLSANAPPAKPIVQFQVGATLAASATDGDIPGTAKAVDVSNSDVNTLVWRWYRGGTLIRDAQNDPVATNTYTVTTDDVSQRIKVVASYTVVGDNGGREQSASLTSDYPVLAARSSNDPPEFDPSTVTREVNEGKKGMNVGAPVTATDDITNALSYALGDAAASNDNEKFEIDQKTGQIKTRWDLNREGTAEATATAAGACQGTDGTECTVTVIATDSAGLVTTTPATVTIKLTNVDEKPEFTEEAASALSPKAITSPENETALWATGRTGDFVATAAGVTYAATDPEDLNVNLTLMGPDAAKFSLSNDGVLSFVSKPDYEMPTDVGGDNVYDVTVRATDGTGMTEDRMVKVTVTDEDEAPEIIEGGLDISGSSSMDFEENSSDAVATFTARGPMREMARWTLEGADAMYFSVGTARGAMTDLMFRSAPDYEMPRGMAMSDANTNTYMVTLKADDGTNEDAHNVTVRVTNADEDGTVTLSSMAPVVGDELTATLMDDDGMMGATWQWSKSMTVDGDFTDIDGADMASYTPVAADDGYYLRATATYTDAHDSQTAMGTTNMAVVSNRAPMFEADTATRTVAENTAAGMDIGDPVTAMDPDGDTLTYSLSGTDEASFDIGTSTGQLMTKADLDYETKTSYMVMVQAEDPDGLTDTIEVTINVTDVDEDPLLTKYDTNKNGMFERSEVLAAINRYLDAEEGVTRAEVIAVINRFLDS